MNIKTIGRGQVWLGVAYSVPLLPLSLLAGLGSNGLALIVLVPLWIAGISLMRAQYLATEETGPAVWWYSLIYHALPLLGLIIFAQQTLAVEQRSLTLAVLLILALFSPLLGTVLSVIALVLTLHRKATRHIA